MNYNKTLIITASDAKYFTLAQGTILSIRHKPQGQNITIAFFDLGCTEEQIQWLEKQVNIIKKPNWDFDFPGREKTAEHIKGLLVRPLLREYFPNFDIYLWIDADAWVQDWGAIDLFIRGAAKRGLAIVPEVHRASQQLYGGLPQFWTWIYQKYQVNFGDEIARKLCSYPMLNAGVFALHKDAPHWQLWREYIDRGLQRSGCAMTDQFALNVIVYHCDLFKYTEMLPAWCNWIFNGLPAWDKEKNIFVEPYLPHTPIGIVHLAGRQQLDRVKIMTTDLHTLEVSIRYPINKTQPEIARINTFLPQDYISPGFKTVKPDFAFPNMIVADPHTSSWPYLRREIPHNWYVDKRHPVIGFLSRDEAHILYNNALQFKGKKALEIGCWMGWSATHLLLAGVDLDIVDPLLAKPEIRDSVVASLQAAGKAAGIQGSVTLNPGYSPQKVEELVAKSNKKWSLIFIDGEHGAPGPLNDAISCEKYAEADAMILFHDLTAPDVAQGLDYLKDRGWRTMIYQTMQIMGVAWRGNVQPVAHQCDPKVAWTLPKHLEHYTVSDRQFLEDFRQLLRTVRPYTMLSEARLFSLYSLARKICLADVEGNFVECGTCKGGSAAVLAYVIKHYSKRPRLLYAFDTFEGMPDPIEVDRHNGIAANDTGFGVGTLKAPIAENLAKICQILDLTEIVVPVKGLFANTLPQYKAEIGTIALLHADGDWYESTMDIFNTLFDRVIAGGFIQVDDYGHWEGCKKALHNFENSRNELFKLHQIDYTGVWFQK